MVEATANRAWVDNWWLYLVRGLIGILFGALAFARPMAALMAIVFVWGIWALVDGLSALALAFSGKRRSWKLALIGLVGVAAGVITFLWPGIAGVALYATVACWSIARGVLEIAVAIELRKVLTGEVWLVLAGISSIAFGVLLIIWPLTGIVAVAWLVGIYAITFGALMCALAVRLYQGKKIRPGAPFAPSTV
jgi:uncharacterized membrane protein HdeD (DUF308 family)